MRILMVMSTPMPPSEGIGTYVFNLSHNLIRLGHDVRIISRSSGIKNHQMEIDGVNVFLISFLPVYPLHVDFHSIFVNKELQKWDWKPDLVHIHSPLPAIVFTNKPIVLTIHTPIKIDASHVEKIGVLGWAIKFQAFYSNILERKLVKRSEIVATVSSSVTNELISLGYGHKKIVTIGNGVNHFLYDNSNKTFSSERYILYVGRLAHRKGLFDLIEAFDYVNNRYKDLRLKIVGKGPMEGAVVKKVDQLGITSFVDFLGHIPFNKRHNLIKLYNNCLLFVQPSHYEGLPTTLLEAMSCGCPVVATAVSGNIDVIFDRKNGILVPAKMPIELTNSIIELVENPELRGFLSKNARQSIVSNFSWESISRKYLKLYEELHH